MTEPTVEAPRCLDHALAYAAHGWAVLPLVPGGKEPAPALAPNGFHSATTDGNTIRHWFDRFPGVGIAAVPGSAGLVVLDIDVKDGKRGREQLHEIQAANDRLPDTLVQRTPSGGMHLFFRLPAGVDPGQIRNVKLPKCRDIDIRCSAGYVCVEPTRLEGGGRYLFDDWDVVSCDLPEIAEAPGWLVDLLLSDDWRVEGRASPQERRLPPGPVLGQSERDQVIQDLLSALAVLSADAPEPEWHRVTCAMKAASVELGFDFEGHWTDWSRTSTNPRHVQMTDEELHSKWRRARTDKSSYKVIIRMAMDRGWQNPAARYPLGYDRSKPAQRLEDIVLPGSKFWHQIFQRKEQGTADPSDVASGGVYEANEPPFSVIPFADLLQNKPEPPAFWWDGYLPAGHVTLLSAHGGVGKSLIALMLAVSVALGRPMFGLDVKPGAVCFFSGEDGADLIRWRLAWSCEQLRIAPHMLAGRLHILDATEGDPALFRETDGRGGVRAAPTRTYGDLGRYVHQHGIDVVIVDNASDAFDGNENARPQVRGFIRSLNRLAKGGRAVLLLGHIDKASARGMVPAGNSYSGSTAWNNSVRSRISLTRDGDGGLVLTHEKLNVGRTREDMRLTWVDGGLPQVDGPADPFVQRIEGQADLRELLRGVQAADACGEHIAPDPRSKYNAKRVLTNIPGFPRRLVRRVGELVRVAETRGLLERVEYRDSNRKKRERWSVTGAGLAFVDGTDAPSAPSAPS